MRMQHLKRRHKKMHRSPILKNKRSLKKLAKKSKKWAISQRLVAHRTLMSGVAPDSLRREATDRRSLAVAPDCPVCHGQTATVGSNGRLL
jgi:hypothetical protein